MINLYSFSKNAFLLFFCTLFLSSATLAQVSEGFDGLLNPNSGLPNGWKQVRFGNTYGYPNSVAVVSNATSGLYPLTFPVNGNNMLRYNHRNIAYPALNNNIAGNGESVLLASKPLDWSGRDTTSSGNANKKITFSFYRDNSATGGVNMATDRIEVYLNDQPDTVNAVLLTEGVTGASVIHRSNTLSPAAAPGWQLLSYDLPAQVPGTGGRFDTTSNAYVIFRFISNSNTPGGNNMFIDNINLPEWKTPMTVTYAGIYYKNPNLMMPGATNTVAAGIRIHVKGSLNPIKLDRFVCYQSGSTDYVNDVLSAQSFFTHDTTYVTSSALNMPPVTGTGSVPPFDFGFFSNPCTYLTPAGFTLNNGVDNYVWITLNLKPGATPGNVVSMAPAFITAASNCANNINISNTTSIDLRIGNHLFYPYPVFTKGTSHQSYQKNDFIGAVQMEGELGSLLDNWYHDTKPENCSKNCFRFAAHPDDYTFFSSENAGTNKSRLVNVAIGRGIRTDTGALKSPYDLKVAAGANLNDNLVQVWIDWNQDGDFNDTYYIDGGPPTDSINEYLGVKTLDKADLSNPFTVGKFETWQINVPLPTDSVIDNVKPNGSNSAVKEGLVRMRLIESYKNPVTDPLYGAAEFGEIEDYLLSLINPEVCPDSGFNTCRWIGNSSKWTDASNWCPAVPTLNDIAYIPQLQGYFNYPEIDSGTVAECRSLKIADGAHIDINCRLNGSLKVADSLIIGVGTITANSYIKVADVYRDLTTIPGESTAPPSGSGFVPQSFFQVTSNLKIQVAYTADELANKYGWQPGDVIDTLRLTFKSTTGTSALFQNFRIVKYTLSKPVSWSNPFAPNVDAVVRAGYPDLVSGPQYIFGNASGGETITLNLPNDGISYYDLVLNQNSFVWDGNNVVLSFEFWSGSTAGKGNYVIYTEPSSVNNVLTLKCNSGAANASSIASGYNLSGYQRSLVAPYNLATITSTGIQPNYCASNQRPRIGFTIRRSYPRFPIIVGGSFINNNPFGILPGADGFVAGNSSVTFDPSIRAGVSSPGLTFTDSVINPTIQASTLLDDTMFIASGWPGTEGNSETIFNELILKATDAGPTRAVKMKRDTYANYLSLISGELFLNRFGFTVLNSKPDAVSSTSGWIRSENGNGNMNSIFIWKIGSDTGVYNVPFGISRTDRYPFTYKSISGEVGDLTMATYRTGSTNNQTLPNFPVNVNNMLNQNGYNVGDSCVDRFWLVQRNTFGAIQNEVTFRYNNSVEGTTNSSYAANRMKVIRYTKYGANWRWSRTSTWPEQTDQLNGIVGAVTVKLNDEIKPNNWLIYTVQKTTCSTTNPAITYSGPAVLCSGDTAQLTSSTAFKYLWSTGSTSQTLNVASSGNYTVTAYNVNGCSAAANMTITVYNTPNAEITASGPLTFCAGDSVLLSAPTSSTYLWSTGSTKKTITVKQTGTFIVTVTNAAGCSNTSTPVVATRKSKPNAVISANGPATFCQGGSVTLSCSSNNSYLWSTGATTQSINVNSSGNYTVMATNAFGCTRISSPYTVTVNSLPNATITASGPTTFCNGDSVVLQAPTGGTLAYQWRKNGNNINGAVSSSYTAKTAGSYLCYVSSITGCANTSNIINVVVNCRQNAGNTLVIYPNPADELVNVLFDVPLSPGSIVEITDMAGRVVHSQILNSSGSLIEINTGHLASGSYLIGVVTSEQTVRKLLMIEHK